MGMTDLELAERARGGDRDAFQELLERHYDVIYRVAYRFTGSVPDAEDIAQDVCLKLVDTLGKFRGDSAFATWLYRVAVNACRDHVRQRVRSRKLEEDYAPHCELARANEAHNSARANWLSEAINRLAPKYRETAVLVLSEDMSHGQVADVLGCTESTVSWRMHEVRKQLKAFVDASDDR